MPHLLREEQRMQNKKSLAFRTRMLYFGVPALAIVLLIVIGNHIISSISDDFARRLARQYSIETAANFLTSTNSHFVLAQQLAHSTTISRWLVNENDEAIRNAAIEEIMGFSAYAPHVFLMFTAYESKNVYDLRIGFTEEDFVPWWQVEANAQWFLDAKYAELPFQINIQRSRPVNGIFSVYVWTNHRMYYNGDFVGVITAGSPFGAVFDTIFGDFDIRTRRGYIIDELGMVRVDSAQRLEVLYNGLSNPQLLPEALQNQELAEAINWHLSTKIDGAFNVGKEMHQTIALGGAFRYASIAPIVGTNWSVVVLSANAGTFDVISINLVIAAFVILVLLMIAGNFIYGRMTLIPLYKLTESTATTEGELFGLNRGDEIGDLARTIYDSQEKLKHREQLLNSINKVAELLLTSREEPSKAIAMGMEIIGKSLMVDRIHCWRNEIISGEVHYVLKHSWISDDDPQSKEIYIGMSFAYKDVPGLFDKYSSGEVLNSLISEMNSEHGLLLGSFNLKSMAAYPIFINNEFFGVISAGDCQNERKFTDGEIELLASCGLMFATTLIREEQADAMQNAREAEKSNRQKSRFLARMSHEIRTPITSVLGVSEIQLRNPNLPRRMEEAFGKINDSAQTLLHIVNDILDFSKVESGKVSIKVSEYEIATLVNNAAQTYQIYLEHKNIEFLIDIDENLPARLIGDILRIRQIMNNLITNAFKYTEEGTVELSLSSSGADREGLAMLNITIKDTGYGMTREQLDDLKNSEYMRFHQHNEHQVGGTGLGIPIVRKLVQMMSGEIEFESEPGQGTKVSLSIPQELCGADSLGLDVANELENISSYVWNAAENFMLTFDPMPHGKVLVVDDVEANLYVIKGLLEFYELTVETCMSGKEAIEKIKQGEVYDVILMDYLMPNLTGTETLHIMRDMGYTNPIVALTANALVGQKEEYLASGFDDFISKPIKTKLLHEVLTRFIQAESQVEDMEAFLNEEGLLTKLRADFVRGYAESYINISNYIETGDIETAYRLSHSIKGLAGLINEEALAVAAGKLEKSFKNGKIPSEVQLSEFEGALTEILGGIKLQETPYDENKAKKSDSKQIERLKELLDELFPLLKERNAESLRYSDRLKNIPEAVSLVRQIEDFEFGLALKTLGELQNL